MRNMKLNFYFESTNCDPPLDVAELDFYSVKYDNNIITIAIKTKVKHKEFFFVDDKHKKYKRKKLASSGDYHIIEVENDLDKIPVNNRNTEEANYLSFEFNFGETDLSTDFILYFEIPLVKLQLIDNKYCLKIKGFKENSSKTINKLQQNVTEEGVIIFEPD